MRRIPRDPRGGRNAYPVEGGEDAPRPVQTSVPTATDMFEQIVQDKPACFGNEPLSLPLFSPYVSFRTYVRMQTYIYIYTFTNTRMADAPRPRYATSSSLSLSDRLNPRPAFLFKPRAFGYGTGFESFVGSTVAASTVFARRNYSTNFLHFQSREY